MAEFNLANGVTPTTEGGSFVTMATISAPSQANSQTGFKEHRSPVADVDVASWDRSLEWLVGLFESESKNPSGPDYA